MKLPTGIPSLLTLGVLACSARAYSDESSKSAAYSRISLHKYNEMRASKIPLDFSFFNMVQGSAQAIKIFEEQIRLGEELTQTHIQCVSFALSLFQLIFGQVKEDDQHILINRAEQTKKYCQNSTPEFVKELINNFIVLLSSLKYKDFFEKLTELHSPKFPEKLAFNFIENEIYLSVDDVLNTIIDLPFEKFKKILEMPENKFLVEKLIARFDEENIIFDQNIMYSNRDVTSYSLLSEIDDFQKKKYFLITQNSFLIENFSKDLNLDSQKLNFNDDDYFKFDFMKYKLMALIGTAVSIIVLVCKLHNLFLLGHQIKNLTNLEYLGKTTSFIVLHTLLLLNKSLDEILQQFKLVYEGLNLEWKDSDNSKLQWSIMYCFFSIVISHFSKKHINNIKNEKIATQLARVEKSRLAFVNKIEENNAKNLAFEKRKNADQSKRSNRLTHLKEKKYLSSSISDSVNYSNPQCSDSGITRRMRNFKAIGKSNLEFNSGAEDELTTMTRLSPIIQKLSVEGQRFLLNWKVQPPTGRKFEIKISENNSFENGLNWQVKYGDEKLNIVFIGDAKKEFLSIKDGNKSDAWAASWNEYLLQKLPGILVSQENPLTGGQREWNCMKILFNESSDLETRIEYKPKKNASIDQVRLIGSVIEENAEDAKVITCVFDKVAKKR